MTVFFKIEKEELEGIWQNAEMQGGSVHRKNDIQKICDRVIARGPMPDFAEKTTKKIDCPMCGSLNTEPSWGSEGYMQCNRCGKEWRDEK